MCRRAAPLLLAFAVALWVASALPAAAPGQEPPGRTLRVGVYNFRPLVFQDADGAARGLFVDVLEHVAEAEGWRLTYVFGTFGECLERLRGGELDLLPAVARTRERAAFVDFTSDFLFLDWGVIFAAKGAKIENVVDLRDKRVGVLEGSAGTEQFRRMLEAFSVPAHLVEFGEYRQVISELSAGRLDAGITTQTLGLSLQREFPRVEATPIVFAPTQIRIAVPRGRVADVLAALDRHIARLKADPGSFYYERLHRWISPHRVGAAPPWVPWAFGGAVALVALALGFAAALRLQVRRRTAELARANRALADAAETYRALFDQAGDPIFIHDLRGRVLEANDAAAAYLGYPREELRRISLADFDAPEDDALYPERTRELVEEGSVAFEATHVSRGGQRIPVEVRARSIAFQGEPSVLSIVRDVSERRRAEEKLRESEELYRALFEQSGDFVWVFRMAPGGVFVADANEAAAAGHGYSREELLGQPLSLIDTEVAAEAVAERAAALSAGRPLLFTGRHRRKDGSTLDVEVRLAPVRVGGETLVLSVERDITERLRLEAEKQQLEANLRQAQKMEAIGTLAGGIAHDFNNILTPIMAHGELALLQLAESDPVRDDIAALLGAAERAAELVKQILAISRREEAGAPVPVSVGALVKETAKFLRASIPTTIDLRVEVDAACGPVLAEPTRLHQVILNLCTNASYAMAENGGVLKLSLGREAAADGSAAPRRVRLAVADTGPGIPAAVRARIFEPYFTTKPTGKGSGLGLAVVHGIVASLGGEIRVASQPGEGATFEVLLPEAAVAEPATAAGLGEIPRGRGQHVLVVDDESAVRTVLARMLGALGYRVTESAGSAAALAAFRTDPLAFDAVITDYTMPGMTGIDLSGELLRLRPDLPVILGTGFAEAVDRRVVLECGLRELVMKPYDLRKVGEALGRVLGA